MTNQQIIITILIALLSTFAKFVFEKILGPYIPERKKLISYTKKFFRFILLYVLPIAGIIFLLIKPSAVDKPFIFCMALNFSALVLNLSTSNFVTTMNAFDDHKISQRGTLRNHFNAISEMIRLSEVHTEQIKKIEDFLRSIKQ